MPVGLYGFVDAASLLRSLDCRRCGVLVPLLMLPLPVKPPLDVLLAECRPVALLDGDDDPGDRLLVVAVVDGCPSTSPRLELEPVRRWPADREDVRDLGFVSVSSVAFAVATVPLAGCCCFSSTADFCGVSGAAIPEVTDEDDSSLKVDDFTSLGSTLLLIVDSCSEGSAFWEVVLPGAVVMFTTSMLLLVDDVFRAGTPDERLRDELFFGVGGPSAVFRGVVTVVERLTGDVFAGLLLLADGVPRRRSSRLSFVASALCPRKKSRLERRGDATALPGLSLDEGKVFFCCVSETALPCGLLSVAGLMSTALRPASSSSFPLRLVLGAGGQCSST